MSHETNFPLRQLLLTFAYLAYSGEEISPLDNPDPTISKLINQALPQIELSGGESPEEWEIVWGPVTYTVPGAKYQENMMYIVNRKGSNDFIIASRGTNFVSQVDWFLDDFEILYTMPWPIPQSGDDPAPGVEISESTSIDINIHIDDSLMAYKNVGLIDFLRTVTSSMGPINICVTGHSLGAAVANVLSLYLLENPHLWDHLGESTVSCISFAAPTIGNDKFAARAMAAFEDAAKTKGSFPGWDTSMGTNLDNVRCNFDTIPYFSTATNIFNHDKAGKLFSIYAAPNNSADTINISNSNLSYVGQAEWSYFQSLVLKNIAGALASQKYTQLLTDSVIEGQFVGSSLYLYDSSLPSFLEAFGMQAAWQHSNSYPVVLNIPALIDPHIVNKTGGDPTAEIPVIDSISPGSFKPGWIEKDVTVTITGSNFANSTFGNFIMFEGKQGIPYSIKSVSDTQIVLEFHTKDIPADTYNVYIYHTSPFFKSNIKTFTIES